MSLLTCKQSPIVFKSFSVVATLFLFSNLLPVHAEITVPLTAKTSQLWINDQWKKADIGAYDKNSVVFYSASSSIGVQRGLIRMKQGINEPEFRFQEWSNLDGKHIDERINLITLNKGRWHYGDHELEVGTSDISGTETWIRKEFPEKAVSEIVFLIFGLSSKQV